MCTTSMFKQYPTHMFKQYEFIIKNYMTMIANKGLNFLWWGTFTTKTRLPWTPKQILFQVAID
jgi:hypothetical protein